MKLPTIIAAVLVTVLHSGVSTAVTLIDELRKTPVSQYEFGLFRLSSAAEKWASDYSDKDIDVVLSLNKNDGIDFVVIAHDLLSTLQFKSAVSSHCNDIRQSFLSHVLANFGDPSEKNINDENMYFVKWGRFFTPLEKSNVKLENTGRAVSKKSIVTVFAGAETLEKCSYKSGQPYEFK